MNKPSEYNKYLDALSPSLKDVFLAGSRAFQESMLVYQCPYSIGTPEFVAWVAGYAGIQLQFMKSL